MTLTAGKTWYGLPVSDKPAHVADFARCVVGKYGMRWVLSARSFQSQNEDGMLELDDATALEEEHALTVEELEDIAKGGSADLFLDAATTACMGPQPPTTELGRLGVGLIDMEVGDVVCVLYGGAAPFIIRSQGVSGYCMVGESYIYGLMHGEAASSNLITRESWVDLV